MQYTCENCNKKYVRKSAFNNHLLQCKFYKICRETSNINGSNFNYNPNNPNINDMYNLLIHLYNKYDKLQDDYDKLKKFVEINKKKIDIIEYLNTNFDTAKFDFIDFTNSINIDFQQLDILFQKDYVEGIFQIIIDNINNNNNLPIKAYNHKDGILYIYVKEPESIQSQNISYKWIIMEQSHLDAFIKYFNKKLLNLFLEWKIRSEKTMDRELFGEAYIINMKKVIGANFEKKNKEIMIKNKLYKHLKQNMKNIVNFDIE